MAQNGEIAQLFCCEQILLRFFSYLDDRDHEAQVSLMADDGVWERQGKHLKGPEGVRAAMAVRSPTIIVSHILTNLVSEFVAPDRVSVRGYLTAYYHDEGRSITPPGPLSGPKLINRCHAALTRSGAGWRISKLNNSVPVLVASDA